MAEFLDTNVIIRYVTNDVPTQAAQAKRLFDAVQQGNLSVMTCEAVLVEAVYVLTSKKLYNRPREEVRDYLTALLELRGLQIAHKDTYKRALELYASTKLRFVDAVIVAHMERDGITTVFTFDAHFDGIPGINRKAP